MCRDAINSDAVLSSDEETETMTITGSVQPDLLTVYGKDKCRKSLKLTSDQLVSHLQLSFVVLWYKILSVLTRHNASFDMCRQKIALPH